MGLKIERFKKKTEDWISSHVQKFITNQTGHDIPFSIDWESFGEIEDDEEMVKKGLSYSILEGNLKTLCGDDLGAGVFKSQVNEIVVQHTDLDDPAEMGYELKKGKLIYITNQKQRIFGSARPMAAKLEGLF